MSWRGYVHIEKICFINHYIINFSIITYLARYDFVKFFSYKDRTSSSMLTITIAFWFMEFKLNNLPGISIRNVTNRKLLLLFDNKISNLSYICPAVSHLLFSFFVGLCIPPHEPYGYSVTLFGLLKECIHGS